MELNFFWGVDGLYGANLKNIINNAKLGIPGQDWKLENVYTAKV
jgi:hypothetical protein